MESVRRHIESQVLSLTGLAVGGVDFESPKGDPGLFGPDAACWKVHGDFSSMMIGGIGALLLQMLHPLALAGGVGPLQFPRRPARAPASHRPVHLGHHLRPAGRCRATDRAGPAHPRSVIGQLPDGTPYSASDPDLLTWVHVAEVSSFLKSYLRYLNPDLPGSEQDRYYSKSPWSPNASAPRGTARPRARSPPTWRRCVHACVATNAPAKWCGFSSTHRRPAPGQAVRRADAARRRRAVAGMGRIDARPPVQSAATPPDPRQRQAQRTLAALGGAQRFDASSLLAHGLPPVSH